MKIISWVYLCNSQFDIGCICTYVTVVLFFILLVVTVCFYYFTTSVSKWSDREHTNLVEKGAQWKIGHIFCLCNSYYQTICRHWNDTEWHYFTWLGLTYFNIIFACVGTCFPVKKRSRPKSCKYENLCPTLIPNDFCRLKNLVAAIM